MKRFKIVVLSVSVGAGHTRAAEALVDAASELPIDVETLDILPIMPRAFQKLYKDTYLETVNKAPRVFSWLYDLTDRPFRPDSIRMALEEASARKFYQFLDEAAPDLVLSTHFLPASLAHQRRKKGKGEYCLATVVTDFDVHGMWLGAPTDHYFVAVPEARNYLQSFGVSGRAITVSGIPTHSNFAKPKDRTQLAQELGLHPSLPTILVSAGGLGTANVGKTLDALKDLQTPAQIVAACGSNEDMCRELQARFAEHEFIHPIGFTKRFEDYMTCSDLMLGKPGGLTTWESFVKGLAWVVVDPLPGQEERNTFHLLEEGVGIWAYEPRTLAFKVDELLTGNRLKSMRQNALRMARPDAADLIWKTCLELLK